ncbi:MAG TPA: 3-hydroxyacyl-CoA dehydrogenase NAD-binding domain-containing protein, partial [Bryobacteraceae bacterium]|nr:3-hydroxyacyl-CoA dehydrogenase NAD-binding domain-containing protein [Bryobacteraceae bacterium]
MSDLVQSSKSGEIGILTVNNPPVNALSPGVPEGILAGVEAFDKDDGVRAIVLIGGGRTFIAGADIKEFGKMTSGQTRRGPGFNEILNTIEKSNKPVVAAIHGTAFGGGLETAMACHYRVAVADAQVGQPEVKLGIIPGAAGTQRLPRLAGIQKAVEMCATGDPVKAPDALKAGILDQIVEGDLLAGAIAFAKSKAGQPPRRTRDLTEKLGTPEVNAPVFAAARDAARKRARNVLAPQAAIDAVEAATKLPFEEGIARESELFQNCLFSDQSKSMIHVFFGEREVAKIPDIGKDVQLIPVNKVAVIGAGTMGGGIAMNFANAGISVLIKETDQAALDRGMNIIKKNYANSVAKGRFTQAQMDERVGRITPQLTYDGFDKVDMIVEAVFEGMALKKTIFGEIDNIAKPGTILASNTSTLNVDEIASATKRPEFVIGTHFFSPANVMRLLELVRGAATSKEVIATCMALSKKIGKIGVLVGNCWGFVGNRMFGPYRREAQYLALEGAKVADIDKALYDWGMAMGPLATGDLAGLDVGWRIRKELALTGKSTGEPTIEDLLCELGRYGQKTGAGWYKYDENRRPSPDPVVDGVIAEAQKKAGITPRTIGAEECVERAIYGLVNEGARILEEGFALRSVDIDIIYLNGYG